MLRHAFKTTLTPSSPFVFFFWFGLSLHCAILMFPPASRHTAYLVLFLVLHYTPPYRTRLCLCERPTLNIYLAHMPPKFLKSYS